MSTETSSHTSTTEHDRHRMIAVAAYFLSERRGFAPGEAERDWVLAEHQIERMIEELRQRGQPPESLKDIDIRNALRLWSDEPRR